MNETVCDVHREKFQSRILCISHATKSFKAPKYYINLLHAKSPALSS